MILVSNDFPPKVGGIQNYLYELWSRLPLSNTKVITTKYPGASEFDREQSFSIDRYSKILWPTPRLVHKVNSTIKHLKSDVVFIDPLLPTGLIIPHIKQATKILIIHGAEVTVPGRIFGSKSFVKRAMSQCDIVLSAGHYSARELVHSISRPVPLVNIPPGVDVDAFCMPDEQQKIQLHNQLCEELNIALSSRIITSVSRLVPRKGFDIAIRSLKDLDDDIHLVIIGKGRDLNRLTALAQKEGVSSRVHFRGTLSHQKLVETYHGSDVFLMLCRDRWGGLEAEGFGIVFLEAAACGLPVIAGRSGGSSEALVDGQSGFLVDPNSVSQVREKLRMLLDDKDKQNSFGVNGRAFVEKNHSYGHLAAQLLPLVTGDFSGVQTYDG